MAILYGSAVSDYAGNIRQSTRSFAHARKRSTLSTFEGTPTTSDQLVLGLLKSNDMLIDVSHWTDGAATAGNIDLGLYEVDMSNGSTELTVIDQDLFATARGVTVAITYQARISLFNESTTLDDVMDRGKSLWSLAAIGAASYTEDPGKTFAIVATPTTTVDAATEMAFEIEYVAGD